MESVLVPVDGSDASAHAAAWAARYAAARGAELILLHVHAARGSETLALGALDAAQIEEAERRIAGQHRRPGRGDRRARAPRRRQPDRDGQPRAVAGA